MKYPPNLTAIIITGDFEQFESTHNYVYIYLEDLVNKILRKMNILDMNNQVRRNRESGRNIRRRLRGAIQIHEEKEEEKKENNLILNDDDNNEFDHDDDDNDDENNDNNKEQEEIKDIANLLNDVEQGIIISSRRSSNRQQPRRRIREGSSEFSSKFNNISIYESNLSDNSNIDNELQEQISQLSNEQNQININNECSIIGMTCIDVLKVVIII
jgi:hypothetical protein